MRKSVFNLDKTLHCPPYSFDKLHWTISLMPKEFSIKKYEIGHIEWSIPFSLELIPVGDPKALWRVSYLFFYNVEKFYNARYWEDLNEKRIETVTEINSEDRIVKISKIIFCNNDILNAVKKRVHENTLDIIKDIIEPQQYIKMI